MAVKIKVLKRKVIIREYDFERVKTQAFSPLSMMGSLETLYDRAEFRPLVREELEKENLVKILKNPDKKNPFKPTEIPASLLFNIKDYLYNENYTKWHSEYDSEGYIWIQARKNTPRSRLGWAIFEKDIESKI